MGESQDYSGTEPAAWSLASSQNMALASQAPVSCSTQFPAACTMPLFQWRILTPEFPGVKKSCHAANLQHSKPVHMYRVQFAVPQTALRCHKPHVHTCKDVPLELFLFKCLDMG